ncbi:hypothetical protein MD484_g769, partial [Candolleomyces efflorescens]
MEALDIPSVIILQYNGHKIAVPRPGATSKYRDLQVKSRAYFSIPDASRIRFFTTELATAEGEEVEISKDAWKDIVSKARRLHVKAVPREPATVVSRQASASTVHSTKDESDAPMPTRKGPRLTTLGVVPYTTFQIFVKTLSGPPRIVNPPLMTSSQNAPARRHRAQTTIPVREVNPNECTTPVLVTSDHTSAPITQNSGTIEEFSRGEVRGKGISKTRSTFGIGSEEGDTKEQVLQSCIHHLDQTKRNRYRDNSASDPASGSSCRQERSDHSNSSSRQHKRPRSSSTDVLDDGEGSVRSKHPPQKRLRESDMPWFEKDQEARRRMRSSCVESGKLLRTYGKDIKKVKGWVTFSASAPSNFPSSEWENLLRGEAVDLDVVLSSLYDFGSGREDRVCFGDCEIKLYSEPSRKVLTRDDWTVAWNLASKATTFLFPHRRQELDEYAKHIQGEFLTREVEEHWRVIRLDQSIRNQVGGGVRSLLTDFFNN